MTEPQIHSLENLRGIPHDISSRMHLCALRNEWNRFYADFSPDSPLTVQQLLDYATKPDLRDGSGFRPPMEP
ncbi:hypothetical protein [Cellulomonas sp.]|uniref:hypothetical protein n=1 Tax=Cellulomonas sp. TaxID=40001 RepID=UPI003BA9DF91